MAKRGSIMAKSVVWSCDWCALECRDEHEVDKTWAYRDDHFLLCPECDNARAAALAGAREARRSQVAATTKSPDPDPEP